MLTVEDKITHLQKLSFTGNLGAITNLYSGKAKLGRIIIERDSWIGADVCFDDNTEIGDISVIGMGSRICENSNLLPDMISFGNPCKEYKEISNDYKTKVKKCM